MKFKIPVAIAALVFPAAVTLTPAFATPPGAQAVTNIPWGTTDTSPVGFGGGEGAPGMRITEQGHLDWPDFPAPVEGSTVAANPYRYGASVQARR